LSIPYFKVDLQGAFKETVVGNFIEAYLHGKTPNPCVLCNRVIRFDLFYHRLQERLRREGLLPADEALTFSTGHYARIQETVDGFFLRKAVDPVKDQTYMLYRINKNLLPHFVFPLGDYLKAGVVNLAGDYQLKYTQVKESQDACFVDTDYVDFIARRTVTLTAAFQSGDIVDPEGKVLGQHQGTVHYTVGQRRGLGLGSGPWYVSKLDPQHHRVVVAKRDQAQSVCFGVDDLNWFIEEPKESFDCEVKIRYQTGEIPCRVKSMKGRVQVQLSRGEFVTPGQSAVFYRGDLVLGGGIIT
jgi:tRNA-specific 2-thiouridylase